MDLRLLAPDTQVHVLQTEAVDGLETASERTLHAVWEGSSPMSLDALPIHLIPGMMPSEKMSIKASMMT